jgi:methyltransferase (TIGR00027 family)
MTCLSRASSALEKNPCYKSGDYLAPLLLPGGLKPLLRLWPVRRFFTKVIAPRGMYEYVIARTRYVDTAFGQALADGLDQVLILGAGFDTRALRFAASAGKTMVFELDAAPTQRAKIGQYRKRGLAVPPNLTFVPIDFERETLPSKLDGAGFKKGCRSLFLLEGLLMYLQPDSVDATFRTIRDYAGRGSRVVFDYVHTSVLRGEGTRYGESGAVRTVANSGEPWQFGLEKGRIGEFLAGYELQLIDQSDVQDLEKAYFTDSKGRVVGRINGTHCLVTAERR